jgi:hypothetical protein
MLRQTARMVLESAGHRFLAWFRGETALSRAPRTRRARVSGISTGTPRRNETAMKKATAPDEPRAVALTGLDPWGDPSGVPEYGTPALPTKKPDRPRRHILIDGPTSLQVQRTNVRLLLLGVIASVATPIVLGIIDTDLLSNGLAWLGAPGAAIVAANLFGPEKYTERVRKEHAAGYTFKRLDSLEVDQIDPVSRYVIRARHEMRLTESEESEAIARVRAIRIDGRS